MNGGVTIGSSSAVVGCLISRFMRVEPLASAAADPRSISLSSIAFSTAPKVRLVEDVCVQRLGSFAPHAFHVAVHPSARQDSFIAPSIIPCFIKPVK